MWHMDDGGGWWMLSGWLWMIVFWTLIVWAISRLMVRGGSARRDDATDMEPLEILERRYANGELSDEQFESMRARLLGKTVDREGARYPTDRERSAT